MSTCADCTELQVRLDQMTGYHGDVLTNLEDEVALTVKLEAALEYYKKLAHMWDVACHDMRGWPQIEHAPPMSYSAVVAFAKAGVIGGELSKDVLDVPGFTPFPAPAVLVTTEAGDRELMLEALLHYQNHLQKGVSKMQRVRLPGVIQQAFAEASSPYIDRVDSLYSRLLDQESEEDDGK